MTIPVPTRPFTGEEFLDSLRGGREIWIYGERVPDVTTHPAFRNPARMLARLYDALHAPATHTLLTCGTDTGSGSYTHRYFRAPMSAADLVAARDAIAAWARLTYGWMGRSPDYKASFLATLGANAEYYAPYQENARRWYRAAQERVLYLTHALVEPPGRERRHPRPRPRPGALGERLRVRGRGEVEHVLPGVRLPAACDAPRLHAPGRQA